VLQADKIIPAIGANPAANAIVTLLSVDLCCFRHQPFVAQLTLVSEQSILMWVRLKAIRVD
jgi:hypothetical protein